MIRNLTSRWRPGKPFFQGQSLLPLWLLHSFIGHQSQSSSRWRNFVFFFSTNRPKLLQTRPIESRKENLSTILLPIKVFVSVSDNCRAVSFFCFLQSLILVSISLSRVPEVSLVAAERCCLASGVQCVFEVEAKSLRIVFNEQVETCPTKIIHFYINKERRCSVN